MQPTYFPWLGFFDLIDAVDVFILLDNVKLEKSSWQTRNRLRSSSGETLLTVPVSTPKGSLDTLINETTINYSKPWIKKHLRSIEQNYSKSAFFPEIFPDIERILNEEYVYLSELNAALITWMSGYIGIKTKIQPASTLANIEGVKEERLLSICQHLEVSEYYSPKGSAVYLDKEKHGGLLTDHHIHVTYQDFAALEYRQRFSPFIGYLSAIDAMFNLGAEKTNQLIKQSRNSVFQG